MTLCENCLKIVSRKFQRGKSSTNLEWLTMLCDRIMVLHQQYTSSFLLGYRDSSSMKEGLSKRDKPFRGKHMIIGNSNFKKPCLSNLPCSGCLQFWKYIVIQRIKK
uniref:Uncharacterized protein n=1 Tax=Micrurus lemniscatus lemniscatus TaxID=129467 RepID=A0A2D4I3Z4_MICLE